MSPTGPSGSKPTRPPIIGNDQKTLSLIIAEDLAFLVHFVFGLSSEMPEKSARLGT